MNRFIGNDDALKCSLCGIDAVEDNGSIVIIQEEFGRKIDDLFVCCGGNCDEALTEERLRKYPEAINVTKDLSSLKNPYLYLKTIMEFITRAHDGLEISEEAFDLLKRILAGMADYVMRELTVEEKAEYEIIMQVEA